MKVIRTIYEHWRFPKNCKYNTANGYVSERVYRYKRNFKKFIPSGKGGMSICRLVLDTGEEIIGVAHCNQLDNFNYRLGRTIAHGRAMKELQYRYQEDLKQQFDALPFAQNEATGAVVL